MPNFKRWPIQREPSPIAGQSFPNQQPIVGVFGKEGFGEQFSTFSPAVTAQQNQIVEEINIQELPEIHRIPFEEDVEILAAEMLLTAKRSPTDWKPITYTFDGKNPQQVGRMVGRKTIVFFNASATVTIGRTVNSLGTGSNENFTVPSGNSASIDTEGEFWMTAVSGTTISVLQTFWDLEAMIIAKRRTKREFRNVVNWTKTKSSANTK